MKKNEKGSTLVLAVVVISIIMIVIAAALAISASYYNRSLVNNRKRQAYLGAKTVVTDIATGIMQKSSEYIDLVPIPPNKTSSVLDISTDFPQELGFISPAGMSINIRIDQSSGQAVEMYVLTVYATCTYEGQTVTVNADFEREKDKDPGNRSDWTFLKYYEGDIVLSHNLQIANNLIDNTKKIKEYANKILHAETSEQKNKYRLELAGFIKENSSEEFLKKYSPNGIDNIVITNSLLRDYVYTMLQGSGSIGEGMQLNVDEFDMPSTLKEKYRGKLYLHIMFSCENVNEYRFIVYATDTPAGNVPDWTPRFVYVPEDGHWYYNPKSQHITEFPGMAQMNKTTEEKAKEIYDSIIALCTPEHIVQ